MTQLLVRISAADLPATFEADLARAFAENEKSAATRKAYRSDFRLFAVWARDRGLATMPATPDTVAQFLAWEASQGTKVSTITRRAAAIRYAHRLAGVEPPTAAETVRATMRGIRRALGTAPERKAPLTHELLRALLDACPPSMIGARDRALLALGFAGAFRRSELVALDVADLREVGDGFRVVIRQSKGDQEAHGQEIAIPRGAYLRPVEAVQRWLAAAEISDGPVFRPVNHGGNVQPVRLQPRAVLSIVKRRCAAVGLDVAQYSAHSLRAGFITSAAEAGASIFKMMEVSRHKSVDTLRGYVRSAELFKEHAGAKFL